MKRIFYITISSLLLLSTYSCIVESETRFSEIAEDVGFTFGGTSADISEFLTPEVLGVMSSLGLDINSGSNPENITGTFLASPYCLSNATDPNEELGCFFAPFEITFFNQNNDDLTISYSSRQISSDGNGFNSEVGSGFISGDSNGNFTVIVKAFDADNFENATAFSGTITDDGILNYQDIFVPAINENPNLAGGLFTDEDNLAERQ